MAFQINLSATAFNELEEAVDWYNDRVEGLGAQFIEAVDKRIALLAESPDMFSVKESGYHEIFVEKFPYLIVYKIIKKSNTVRILHVFHTKRNPTLKK